MNAPLVLHTHDAVTDRLGQLVSAVEDRLMRPDVSRGYDKTQEAWPEAIELARSIEQDDGWILFVKARGEDWERLILYLDAPNLFLRAFWRNVDVTPTRVVWSYTMSAVVSAAMRKRFKERAKETPSYSDSVLTDLRARRWARWGRT
jgi:hypothetical protein